MYTCYKPIAQIESEFDCLYADGQYQQAILHMAHFLQECEDDKNPYGALIAHFSIASCYYCLGQIDQAFHHILLYEQLCENYGDQHEQLKLWHIKSLIFEYEHHFQIAKEATFECLRLAKTLQLPHELAINHTMMSRLFMQTEQYQQTIQHAQEALTLLEQYQLEDVYLHCQVLCNLAIAYVQIGDFDEASVVLDSLSHSPYIQQQQRERSMYLYAQSVIFAAQMHDLDDGLTEAEAIACLQNDYTLQKFIFWHKATHYEKQNQLTQAYYCMKNFAEATKMQQQFQRNSKIHDLNQQHKLASIERRANIDPLSGTYTRFHLETLCDQWLTEAHQTNDFICCVVFDVDDFKHINDHYGHLVGDEVIKNIGKVCRRIISGKDTLIGRYGGDEFVVVLKNFPKSHVAQKIQELYQALVEHQFVIDEQKINISISMGTICNKSVSARKFKQIFRVADQALYMAKNQGKSQIVSLSSENCHNSCN